MKQQKIRREQFSAVPLSVPDFTSSQNGSVLRGGGTSDPGQSVALNMDGLQADRQAQMQVMNQEVQIHMCMYQKIFSVDLL